MTAIKTQFVSTFRAFTGASVTPHLWTNQKTKNLMEGLVRVSDFSISTTIDVR